MQQLFAESSVFLQNDRRTAATAPRATSSLFGGPSSSTPSLRHKVASRPVIPPGSRREPGERVFYGDAIVDAVEPTTDDPSASQSHTIGGESKGGTSSRVIDSNEDSFEDITFRESDFDTEQSSNATNSRYNVSSQAPATAATGTPKKGSEPPPSSAPSPGEQKKTPSKKSSGWGSWFGKSSSSSSGGNGSSKPVKEEVAAQRTSPAPTSVPAPAAKPAQVKPAPTKPMAIPAAASRGVGDGLSDDDEDLEDTPMNRAYRERIERERKLQEEEEERMSHRGGGAGSTGDEVLDEWLAGGGDKRVAARRRPAPTGTSQRRPKAQTRPHATHAEGTTERTSLGSNPYSNTPPAASYMPTGSKAQAQNSASVQSNSALRSAAAAGPMSSSYQDHSALFQAAAAQSAARNRQTESTSASAPAAAYAAGASANTSASGATTSRNSGSGVVSSEPLGDTNPSKSRGKATAAGETGERSRANSNPIPPVVNPGVSRGSLDEHGPLPEGWEEVATEEGGRYFYHKVTRISRYGSHGCGYASHMSEIRTCQFYTYMCEIQVN
jgi:hypothetical protein